MKTYLLSATGVIFLSVIVSLLIPEGKLNKSITFVMRLACILVLIRPVTDIFNLQAAESQELFYDYAFICEAYSNDQSEQLEKILSEEFSVECECDVEVTHEDGIFSVGGVTVEVNSQDEKIIDAIYEYLEQMDYINILVYAKSN